MIGFGVFSSIPHHGYLLEMSIAIAVSTLVFTIPATFIASRSSRKYNL
ncbi:hypothetical protein O9992_00770 [Vibrio lentus]|nr:hypothetical protein [Vibrio lentus]